jgi:hypothetical protein
MNLKCGEEDHEGFDYDNDPKCSNCGQPHMVSSKDSIFSKRERNAKGKNRKAYFIP